MEHFEQYLAHDKDSICFFWLVFGIFKQIGFMTIIAKEKAHCGELWEGRSRQDSVRCTDLDLHIQACADFQVGLQMQDFALNWTLGWCISIKFI